MEAAVQRASNRTNGPTSAVLTRLSLASRGSSSRPTTQQVFKTCMHPSRSRRCGTMLQQNPYRAYKASEATLDLGRAPRQPPCLPALQPQPPHASPLPAARLAVRLGGCNSTPPNKAQRSREQLTLACVITTPPICSWYCCKQQCGAHSTVDTQKGFRGWRRLPVNAQQTLLPSRCL